MRLAEYLHTMGESQTAFAERSGVPLSTINRICLGGGNCRSDIALRVVRATQERPTISGAFVSFEEIVRANADRSGGAAA